MVVLYIFYLFLGAVFPLVGEIRVQAGADPVDHFENLSVPVTIIITHPGKIPVDETSFSMEKKRIRVSKVKDVGEVGGEADILSIYRYDLPAKSKGLYILPSIGVKVGDNNYQSIPSTFEVKAMGNVNDRPPGPNAVSAPVSSKGAFLKLESIVRGPLTLFPGQTTVLGYRYSFNANIETTAESTPLFEPKGFVKVGDKVVVQKNVGDTSILEVTQQYQAEIPGTYVIGPSSIEGYVYSEDSLGRRSYAKDKLVSTIPPMTLTVKPIPVEDRPASYNGAVGKYTFSASLKSSSKVTVGDEMNVLVSIGGTGDLESVQLPDLCCQPGMSGVFKLSDLPPVGKIAGPTKTFMVNLRPLTPLVKAIPSLEFSYFDPEAETYVSLHSQPIPIEVSEIKVTEAVKAQQPVEPEQKQDWSQSLQHPLPIEIGANYPLSTEDLDNRWFGTWWALLILPLAIVLLIYQYQLKRYAAGRKREVVPPSSQQLFEDAWKENPRTAPFYSRLYHAFFVRLQEINDIGFTVDAIDKLPVEGAAGDVKALLMAIEECRYAGNNPQKEHELLEQARRLFEELKEQQ